MTTYTIQKSTRKPASGLSFSERGGAAALKNGMQSNVGQFQGLAQELVMLRTYDCRRY
jgi:hypothetical protein